MSLAVAAIVDHTRAFFQTAASLIFDQPVGDLPQVNDARWSAAFTGNSWGAFAVWVLLLIVLQWVSWPLVRRVFTRFPDRGWAFARPVSMLVAGLLVWYPAALGIMSFRAVWGALALLSVALVSLLATRRVHVPVGERRWTSNPTAVTAEVVFWLVFLFFLFFRLINPDSWHPWWGGEKPMDFAHLNAILRSAHFPPVDPWYAGGYLNYYYFGTYLVANLFKITGIPTEIGYNLAISTLPAMLAATTFSLGAALGKRIANSTFVGVTAGILTVFFVQFAGNLIVASRLFERAFFDVTSPDPFSYWVFYPTRALPDPSEPYNITEFPYFGALYADLHPHVIAMPFTVLVMACAWQIASGWRAVPLLFVRKRMTALQVFDGLAPVILAGVTIGSLWMINAWDMPMAAAITVLGLVMVSARIPGVWNRVGLVAALSLMVAVLAWLIALPFNLHYKAPFGQIGEVSEFRTTILGLEAHFGAQILLVTLGMLVLAQMAIGSGARTRQIGFALLPLIPIALLLQALNRVEKGPLYHAATVVLVLAVIGLWTIAAWETSGEPNEFHVPGVALRAAALLVFVVGVVLVIADRQVLAVYLCLGLSAAIIWLGLEKQSARFVAAIIAGAMLLGAALELIYLVDDLDRTQWYRMNTIFKFYNQIWNMLGVSVGVLLAIALWRFLSEDDAQVPYSPKPVRRNDPSRLRPTMMVLVALPVILVMSTYAMVATPVRLDQRFGSGGHLTLNAFEWMSYGTVSTVNGPNIGFQDDLAAINWMNEHVHGTPVILEASFGAYRCNGSRFSIATGLPDVVGWVRHESQQRPGADLTQRENAMRAFYTGTSIEQKEQILETYDVEYVIVGDLERNYPTIYDNNYCQASGNPEAIQQIESMEGTRLEIAYQHGTTTIYRVIRTQ